MSRRLLGRISVFTVLAMTFSSGLFLVATWSVTEVLQPLRLSVIPGELPGLSATAWLVLDLETGTEIASHNSTATLPIASITKLFTAAAFLEHTQLAGTTTVTWADVATEGRAGKLQAGEVYPYHELVQALLVESSNDAASTIARTDTTVLARMNEYPKELGFVKTAFADSSGLSSGNQSTAYEIAQLTRALWRTNRYVFDVSNQSEVIGTYTGWVNNNPFVTQAGYRGGKHGFTYEAGRTATAIFTESISGAERDFIYVLLGSDDLLADIEQLRPYVRKHVLFE